MVIIQCIKLIFCTIYLTTEPIDTILNLLIWMEISHWSMLPFLVEHFSHCPLVYWMSALLLHLLISISFFVINVTSFRWCTFFKIFIRVYNREIDTWSLELRFSNIHRSLCLIDINRVKWLSYVINPWEADNLAWITKPILFQLPWRNAWLFNCLIRSSRWILRGLYCCDIFHAVLNFPFIKDAM